MAVADNEKAWYDFNTSQGYGVNGEEGIDIATPFHTAVSMLFGGTVKSATYQPWGGDVEVQANIPGLGEVTEYMIHLDEIAPGIVPGAKINAGQYIGLSGGENPGYPGAEHPADPRFSSGPHVEWGIKSGSGAVDPTGYVTEARAGGLGNLGAVPPPDQGTTAPQSAAASGGSGAIGGVLGQVLKAIGVPSLPPWQDILGVIIGGVMVIAGAIVVLSSLLAPAAEDAAKTAEKIAPLAAGA